MGNKIYSNMSAECTAGSPEPNFTKNDTDFGAKIEDEENKISCASSTTTGNEESFSVEDGNSMASFADKSSSQDEHFNTQELPPSNNFFLRYYGFSNWRYFLRILRQEFFALLYLAWPMIITNGCTSILEMEDLFFVGRLDNTKYIAAATLGNSYSLILSYAAFGLVEATDTLVSQAFGAENFDLINVILQRSMVIVSVATIPLSVLFFLSDRFFLLLGQDPEVSELAGTFVKYLMIGLWPSAMARVLQCYITAQNIVITPMLVIASAAIFNILFNYVFITVLGLGFIGAPIATSLCQWFQLFGMIVVTVIHKKHKVKWDFREALCWEGIKEFLKIAIPDACAMVFEISGYEISIVISGYMGPAQISAHGIMINISFFAFMLVFGIGVASTIRVGQLLGSNNAHTAKFTASLALVISISIKFISSILLLTLRNVLGRIFTSDEAVIEIISFLAIVVAAMQISDGIQVCGNGILRGMGRTALPAALCFLCYYAIGIPGGLLFGIFLDLKSLGLWIAIALGIVISSLCYLIDILFVVDWQKQAYAAEARVSSKSEERFDIQLDDAVIQANVQLANKELVPSPAADKV